MPRATADEIAVATARRNEIALTLLEVLTEKFTTKELQHYRLVSHLFSIEPVIQELCADSSTLESRTEKALAAAMCALAIACDTTPPGTPQRILDRREARRESREADKQLRESLAGKAAVEPGK